MISGTRTDGDWMKLVRIVQAKLRRVFRPAVDSDELFGAAQLGVVQADSRYDAARCPNRDAWSVIAGYLCAFDELRATKTIERGKGPQGSFSWSALRSTPEVVFDSGDSASAMNRVFEDERSSWPFGQIDLTDQADGMIRNAGLSLRERDLMRWLYVVGGSVKEWAEIMRQTQSRASQLKRTALEKMREKYCA